MIASWERWVNDAENTRKNNDRGVFRSTSSIQDRAFRKNSYHLSTIYNLLKKIYLRCFTEWASELYCLLSRCTDKEIDSHNINCNHFERDVREPDFEN